MPMYSNPVWEDMSYELNDFLSKCPPSDLMHIVSDAVLSWEREQERENRENIPVEWIEKWLDKFEKDNGYRNIIMPKSITIGDTTIMLPCVPDMLEDWRKEDE